MFTLKQVAGEAFLEIEHMDGVLSCLKISTLVQFDCTEETINFHTSHKNFFMVACDDSKKRYNELLKLLEVVDPYFPLECEEDYEDDE